MTADPLLANAERAAGERPPRPLEREPEAHEGHWHGAAAAEVWRWRRRALVAEAEVERLAGLVEIARAAMFGPRAP
jgi:hypothetical protein